MDKAVMQELMALNREIVDSLRQQSEETRRISRALQMTLAAVEALIEAHPQKEQVRKSLRAAISDLDKDRSDH